MSLCRNCKVNISKYECSICNCLYCLKCDSYIHSFPSKRLHKRKYILSNYNNSSDNPKVTQNIINLKSYIISKENDISINHNLPLDNNIKEENNILYDNNELKENININNIISNDNQNEKEKQDNEIEKDKNQIIIQNNNEIKNDFNDNNIEYDNILNNDIYLKKLSFLGAEIRDASENFNNRIEDLHQYFHNIDKNKQLKMKEDNIKNLKEINSISSEKNTQIQQLKEILEEQNSIISQLKNENINLGNILNNNKKEFEKLNFSKMKLIEENKKCEEIFIKKINEIMELNQIEKNKLIEEYNEEMINLKNNYEQKIEQFEHRFKEGNKNLNDYLENKNKEKRDLSIMIDNLKLENSNKIKECNNLKNSNEELEKVFDNKEKLYKAMKNIISNVKNK